MGLFRVRILGVILLAVLVPVGGPIHAKSEDPPTTAVKQEMPAAAPDLANIIPLASKLSGRLVSLENRITGLVDVSAVESRFAEIKADLQGPVDQIARRKKSGEYRHRLLMNLKEEIRQKNQLLEEAQKPIGDAIGQLDTWRKEWMEEKKQWGEWQSALLKDGKPDRLRVTFEEAHRTIDRALKLVVQQLEAMLAVQEKAADLDARIHSLVVEVDDMLMDWRRDVVLRPSPPMFSSRYFSQFPKSLGHAVRRGVDEISWQDWRFFVQHEWTLFIPALLSVFLIIAFHRNRCVLKESSRWHFIAGRPYSAALFFGSLTAVLMFAYEGIPGKWILITLIVVGTTYGRLTGELIDASWKRWFVNGVLTVVIVTGLFGVIDLPTPLFRLYMVLVALVGLTVCMRWAGKSSRQEKTFLYPWALRICSLVLAVIIVVQLTGRSVLALYLFQSFTVSMALSLFFLLFLYMIHGGLDWLFRSSPLRRVVAFHSEDTDTIIRRAARFTDIALLGLVFIPANLLIWGVYDSLEEAIDGVLTLGFNLGSQRINVRLLIVSAGILYGSFIASLVIQKWITEEALGSRRWDMGIRHAIARLIHYLFIFVGFLIALSLFGFRITELTIILSALGVGIGFGLQAIVNNFVCGLILLFERPARVGDMIELGGQWAVIKKIGLRATTVQTFDYADLIIPNADLVTRQVTNWTLTNRRARVMIPVGVAYGSDVPLVMETLRACADESPMISKLPKPEALFLGFGESSLNFELRAYVRDAEDRIQAISDLHQEVDRRFREANIVIAFPQRDLHLRSIDDSINLRPP